MKAREYDYAKEPTINIVKSILSEAVKLRVSDIHFDPTPENLIIRFRIDGDLIEFTTAPAEAKKNILTRIKILAAMNITETNVPQNGTIKYEDKQSSHNMLVSSLPTINGEKIVIHIADYHQQPERLIQGTMCRYRPFVEKQKSTHPSILSAYSCKSQVLLCP